MPLHGGRDDGGVEPVSEAPALPAPTQATTADPSSKLRQHPSDLPEHEGSEAGTEAAGTELPFRIGFDASTGKVVLWVTIQRRGGQVVRRIEVPSLEALTLAVAEHERESRVHRLLAESLVQAAVDHLGADPVRLYAAAAALQDPASTVSLASLLEHPGVDA